MAAESLSMDNIQSRLAAAYQVRQQWARTCMRTVSPATSASAAHPVQTWKETLSSLSMFADVQQCKQHLLAYLAQWVELPIAMLLCALLLYLQEHAASRCPGQLAFHIEDLLGSNSLTCSCATCNSLAVVV